MSLSLSLSLSLFSSHTRTRLMASSLIEGSQIFDCYCLTERKYDNKICTCTTYRLIKIIHSLRFPYVLSKERLKSNVINLFFSLLLREEAYNLRICFFFVIRKYK